MWLDDARVRTEYEQQQRNIGIRLRLSTCLSTQHTRMISYLYPWHAYAFTFLSQQEQLCKKEEPRSLFDGYDYIDSSEQSVIHFSYVYTGYDACLVSERPLCWYHIHMAVHQHPTYDMISYTVHEVRGQGFDTSKAEKSGEILHVRVRKMPHEGRIDGRRRVVSTAVTPARHTATEAIARKQEGGVKGGWGMGALASINSTPTVRIFEAYEVCIISFIRTCSPSFW